MDDLISRKALDDAFTELRWNEDGTLNHFGDRPDWCLHGSEVDKLIQNAPSVPAVPLEMISKKLGSLCKPCMFQTVGCPYKSFDCDSCNTSDAWEKAIRKWMEEEDAQKEN